MVLMSARAHDKIRAQASIEVRAASLGACLGVDLAACRRLCRSTVRKRMLKIKGAHGRLRGMARASRKYEPAIFKAGTQLGSVRVFTWPFPDGEPIRPFTDVALHAHSINTLSLSVNAHLLFSACQGGTVMASHVRPEKPGGGSYAPGQLAQRFVHYRFREDGGSHRNTNREDRGGRKIHDLQRKLTEAGQGFSNQAATMDELILLPKAYFQECLHEIKELEERANSLEHESEYTLEQK
ncbi:unnamed protein product, partial [Prorocentrum cordatum]